MLGFHSQNVPIIIEEDDMKFAKLPLPTTDMGNWMTNVLSTVELITIYNQVKNEQIDGIMIVDSYDYGGQYEQKAISTGFRFNDSEVEFHFSHSYSVDGNQPVGEGFVNNDQTRAIVTVTISLQEYFFINTTAWNNIKGKRGQYLSDLFCVITFTTFGLVL